MLHRSRVLETSKYAKSSGEMMITVIITRMTVLEITLAYILYFYLIQSELPRYYLYIVAFYNHHYDAHIRM